MFASCLLCPITLFDGIEAFFLDFVTLEDGTTMLSWCTVKHPRRVHILFSLYFGWMYLHFYCGAFCERHYDSIKGWSDWPTVIVWTCPRLRRLCCRVSPTFSLQAGQFRVWTPVELRLPLHTHPGWSWGPPSHMYNGCWVSSSVLKGPGHAVHHLPPSSAELKHGRATVAFCAYSGMLQGSFNFTLVKSGIQFFGSKMLCSWLVFYMFQCTDLFNPQTLTAFSPHPCCTLLLA